MCYNELYWKTENKINRSQCSIGNGVSLENHQYKGSLSINSINEFNDGKKNNDSYGDMMYQSKRRWKGFSGVLRTFTCIYLVCWKSTCLNEILYLEGNIIVTIPEKKNFAPVFRFITGIIFECRARCWI